LKKITKNKINNMKKSLFITLIILGSLLHAQKMLRGTVIDESTNLPLTGVNVSFEDSDKLALTDQYGKFELPITHEVKQQDIRKSLKKELPAHLLRLTIGCSKIRFPQMS